MKSTFSVTGRATAAAAVLLVVIAIAPPRATARSVATQVKTCSWFAYNKNITDAGYCTLNDDFVAFNPEKPVSWISKQLRVVYGRNYRCGLFTSESACKAANSKLNCYWSANDRRCLGQEVTQWKWFTRHPYLSEAPQWLKWTCAGTEAEAYRRCSALASYAQPDMGPCKAAKGCAVSSDGKTCTSSLLANMTDQDRSAWFSKYMRLDPSVAGTCGSVCYLRAAFACPMYNIIVDDREREAKCAANKWCFWNPDNCATNLYGSDAWGKAVTMARDACNQLGRNSSACVAGGPTFNAAQDVQVDLPLADSQPSKGTGKCAI